MKRFLLLTFLIASGTAFLQAAPAVKGSPLTEIPSRDLSREEFFTADPDSEKISDLDSGTTDIAQAYEDLLPEQGDSGLPSSEDLGIPPSTGLVKTPAIKKDTNETDTIVFPQWAKDLRRGEIIAFGAFPISIFFSRIFLDLYRMSQNNWDRRYAPWPAKAAGGPGLTESELKTLFGIAASVSVAISVADHLIIRHKRKKAAAAAAPAAAPKPAAATEPTEAAAENAEDAAEAAEDAAAAEDAENATMEDAAAEDPATEDPAMEAEAVE